MERSRGTDTAQGHHEALRILQIAKRDDGMAPSRLHTALNRTTPHSALFFKTDDGPFGVEGQYSTRADAGEQARALRDADVVHIHAPYAPGLQLHTLGRRLVIHHHGTPLREAPALYAADAKRSRALVLLSNLSLVPLAPGAEFLENAMPVATYQRIRETALVHFPAWDGTGTFRVVHTPSKPYRKGSELFLAACSALQAEGLPVEPMIVTGQSHITTLSLKATAHACFDSFDLGMQCSGLEAAAMGLPVLAGDVAVHDRHLLRYRYCPYLFTGDVLQLMAQIRLLMTDRGYYQRSARLALTHVTRYHDEAVVALRYLDLLHQAFAWRR